MSLRIPLFRIWYSTTYTTLFFITIILLAVTPAETIYQSIRSKEWQKIFVIGGAYFLASAIILLVYSARLYTNRTVLAAIPKPYIPIEDGEVGKLVRRMIVKALKRSAIVAWDSRPRDVRGEGKGEDGNGRPGTAGRLHSAFKRRHHHPSTVIDISPEAPPWGHISHPGWASPDSPDLPNLQYWNVVTELPNLIEAKAVSMAPPDPIVDEPLHAHDTPILPDAQVVALLQRPRSMGLRDYLGRLASFGLINPPSVGLKFLAQYEHARFSTQSLTESEFRNLMKIFAEILNGMTELDQAVIETARAQDPELETRSFTQSETSASSTTSSDYYRTPRITGQSDYFQSHDGSESPHTLRTAPSMMRNTSSSARSLPRISSKRSSEFGSVRHHHVPASPSTIMPNSSSSSLRSGGSVVRLPLNTSPGELPFQYQSSDG